MQLWWRSVALQALRTYMGSILNSDRGLVDNAPQQVCVCVCVCTLIAHVHTMA